MKKVLIHWPVILLIVVNIVLGLIFVQDFGESYDEPDIYQFANKAIESYPILFSTGRLPDFGPASHLKAYGPAYFMASSFMANGLRAVFADWSMITAWHFTYFMAFQIGVLSFYFLCKKWMDTWAAFAATLLFSTQPVLWGHSFINPKDIPFMGFFLASVTAGVYAVDLVSSAAIKQVSTNVRIVHILKAEWGNLLPGTKKRVFAYLIVGLLFFVLSFAGLWNSLTAALVTFVYQSDKTSMIGVWFSKIAPNATQLAVENYIHKTQALMLWAETGFTLVYLSLGFWFLQVVFHSFYEGLKENCGPVVKGFFLNPFIWFAGFTLGFATSIRLLAPLAGGMIVLYAFYRLRMKGILFFFPYFISTLLMTYLTWPYLWGDPVGHFIESLTMMARFPWDGLVLFQGKLFPAHALPSYFIPFSMAIQLTEVMLPLFLVGFALSAWQAIKQQRVEPFFLICIWFFLPVTGIILYESVVYDGFRQLLFVVPPLFIAAGITLDALFNKIKVVLAKLFIITILSFSGIYSIIILHPYEYVYYNGFVGGVRGAFHNYELDYWGTSYYEAARYINQVAPDNAKIIVLGSSRLFKDFARADLQLFSLDNVAPNEKYDYIVINGRKNEDLVICLDAPIVKTIERDEALLTVIKIPGIGCP